MQNAGKGIKLITFKTIGIMKKVKFLSVFFLVVTMLAVVGFTSCGKDDDGEQKDVSIFGTWQVTSLSYWDIAAKEMVNKTFNDNDYEVITLTETSFKEEIFEGGKLVNTVTETLSLVGSFSEAQAEGLTGVRVGYSMNETGEVSQIILVKDNNSKKFTCKRKN